MANEDRATRYHRLQRRAELASTAAAGLLLLTLLVTGASVTLRESASILGMALGSGFEETGTVIGMSIILILLMQLLELPFGFYLGFALEHRYGLSTETFGRWLLDQLKGGLLAIVFGAAGATVIYLTMRWSPGWWWAMTTVIFVVVTVLLVQLGPVVLLPLFYTFKPLDRPALVERLLMLADRAQTRIRGVYELALSAHTKKANAYLAGIGSTRRILLSDTLLSDYSDDEIEVVLAHELSHHVHHDVWRGIALQSAALLLGFLLAHATLRGLAGRLELRGIDDPAGLPLLLLAGGLCTFLVMPIAHALSRSHERRADRYALDATRQPAAFISAMKRLSQQNLAEENPSRVVQWLFYSHPPIRERIDAARRWAATER